MAGMPRIFFDHVDEHPPHVETLARGRHTCYEGAQVLDAGEDLPRLCTRLGMQREEVVRGVIGGAFEVPVGLCRPVDGCPRV